MAKCRVWYNINNVSPIPWNDRTHDWAGGSDLGDLGDLSDLGDLGDLSDLMILVIGR